MKRPVWFTLGGMAVTGWVDIIIMVIALIFATFPAWFFLLFLFSVEVTYTP